MQGKDIIFSIIMPAYNSEKTIGKALRSVRKQEFDQKRIEIMVIDGGSADLTRQIAHKYGARLLHNDKKFPEYAKQIGVRQAKGRYIIYQDSDEVWVSKKQLAGRLKLFRDNPGVHCILANRLLPGRHCGLCCSYLNTLADPFGYFVYRYKGSIMENNHSYLDRKIPGGGIYHYRKGDIYPIGDGGTTTIDLDKAKELLGEEVYGQDFAVSAFSRMIAETGYMGCLESDNIVHYSYSTLKGYLKKLRFRIVQNLNRDACAGFVKRERYSGKLQLRKYLFVLYGCSLVLPLLDSFRLAARHRDVTFLLHFFYTYYIVAVTAWEAGRKLLGKSSNNIQYGK